MVTRVINTGMVLGFLWGSLTAPLQAAIILNELMANNISVDINGRTPDWLELYNTSDTAADLTGMSLSSAPAAPGLWKFDLGTVIPAHGFLLVACDNNRPASGQNTGFGLGASGDSAYLFDAASNIVDSVNFGIQPVNYSIGRLQAANGAWYLMEPTPGQGNQPATLGSPFGLRINEWMSNPASGNTWFELYNPDPHPVMLTGLYLTDNYNKPLKYAIPALSFIGVGANGFEKFIADASTNSSANHTNFKLSSKGEVIGLFTASGPIHRVTYTAQALGVSQGYLPDGSGVVVNFPNADTPGESNYLPLPNVVINEVLSHSDPPLEDAIELYNPTSVDAAIGGWYLSDSPSNLKKYQIPAGTILPAHGYHVFYEYQFGDTNLANSFFFNSSEGDTAIVAETDTSGNITGRRNWQSFGASANGISFGRYTNSVGQVDFVAMSSLSFGSSVTASDPPAWTNLFVQGQGAPNPYPLIGPVVISEIMYHPPSVVGTNDNTQDEFIELHNITATNTLLYTPTEYTNTWRLRGGISYDFPTNVAISAGGYLLVVSFDPALEPNTLAAFRSKYNVETNVQVFGPYSGKLGNKGDTLDLEKPDYIQGMTHPNEGFVPHVVVERVDYLSSTAWPLTADQTGYSLLRSNVFLYGNDPANWLAAWPTAGRANAGGALDQDKDGMADDWELANGFNPRDPSDATLDSDGDGLTNLQEYLCGTNPHDPASVLKIESIEYVNEGVILRFTAMAGVSYTVQYKDSGAAQGWSVLNSVAAYPYSRSEEIKDTPPAQGNSRLYRLVVP